MPPSILKCFRLLADPIRVRIVLLLQREELSVAELQEILNMGQSRISMNLSQLKQGGLLEDRRTGKHSLYRLDTTVAQSGELMILLEQAGEEISEAAEDRTALALTLRKRQDRMRAYFDELAGKFGKHYVPGRSWKGLAEALLKLMPRQIVADLGAGEGTLSQLLAQRAEKVIAIDNSENMVAFGTDLAQKHGVGNLEYRAGDLEALPVEDAAVDLAVMSQSLHHAPHPEKALAEAFRILRPGGRIVLLDLKRHQFEQARELYADLWLGFTEAELAGMLEKAGFHNVETSVVFREDQAPHLETVLAIADKRVE